MVEQLELPNAQIYKLVKEGASASLAANQRGTLENPDTGVIISKDSRKAYQ